MKAVWRAVIGVSIWPPQRAHASSSRGGFPGLTSEKETMMPTTLPLTCALCGLRFTSGPLLELHIREDHERRRAPEGDDDGRSLRPRRVAAATGPPGPVGPPAPADSVGSRRLAQPARGTLAAAAQHADGAG